MKTFEQCCNEISKKYEYDWNKLIAPKDLNDIIENYMTPNHFKEAAEIYAQEADVFQMIFSFLLSFYILYLVNKMRDTKYNP